MGERKGETRKKGAGLHSVHTHPPLLSLQSGVGTQKDSNYSSMSSNVCVRKSCAEVRETFH